MSNRLFKPAAGWSAPSAATVSPAQATDAGVLAVESSPVVVLPALGADWCASPVIARVLPAAAHFEMEVGVVADWLGALAPTLKCARISDGNDRAIPAALLKGAAAVTALHAQGRAGLHFCIVVTDACPNSVAFVGSTGNWLRIGPASFEQEVRLALSTFELGGLVLIQHLCEALCTHGHGPCVVAVGTAAVLERASQIHRDVAASMTAMRARLAPCAALPKDKESDSDACDAATDIASMTKTVRRLLPDASVVHIQRSLVWLARTYMSGTSIRALLDFLCAAWVPPPDCASTAVVLPPASATASARGAATEALILDICKWVERAPPRWRARLVGQLQLYVELLAAP